MFVCPFDGDHARRSWETQSLLAKTRREVRSVVVLGRQVQFTPPVEVQPGWYAPEVEDHGEALIVSLRPLEKL